MHSPDKEICDSSAVTVRRMTERDISAALAILEESPEAAIWSRASLLESASNGAAWAAEMEGRVVGILLGRVAADEFEILNLAVSKVHRRRGIATKLASTALEYSRAAGAQQSYLEVRASNEGAIALYAKMGFRVCGHRPNYYRDPVEDAVLLVLRDFGTNP
jgi:ribosomal-protein-alanine N-acetyltransferase